MNGTKHFRAARALSLSLLLGVSCLCGMSGCAEKSDSDSSAASSAGDTESGTVPKENGIELFYAGEEEVPAEYATLMTSYFKAIAENDYAGYSATVFPAYATQLEAYLQKNYSYGLESSFQKRRESMKITDTNHYRFTAIRLQMTEQTTLDEYFTQMTTTFDADFCASIQSEVESGCVIKFDLLAESDDMEKEETVVAGSEMAVAKGKDGKWYVFG